LREDAVYNRGKKKKKKKKTTLPKGGGLSSGLNRK